MLASRANSSVKKYIAQYRAFRDYLRSKGRTLVVPCDNLLLSEYLSFLFETKRSYAIVFSTFCALKWIHELIPYGPQGNPVDTAISRNIVEASKRVFKRPVTKKESITPDMIYHICSKFARDSSSVSDLRAALIFV